MKKFNKTFLALCTGIMVAAGIFLIPGAHAQTVFTDVPQNHPFYEDITLLNQMGVIGGYQDGTFKPDAPVDRAAALKIIFAGSGIPTEEVSQAPFPDVPQGEWFAKFVAKAKQLGIVKGNPDGTYKPATGVDKAAFIKMLLAANGVNLAQHQNLTQPVAADVPADAWYAPYFSWSKAAGVTSLAQNGTLNPSKQLTRGEVAAYMARIVRLKNGQNAQTATVAQNTATAQTATVAQNTATAQENLNTAESKLIDAINAIKNKDIVTAEQTATQAVAAAQAALQQEPNEMVVQGAVKITLSFQQLVAAYKSGTTQKFDEAIQLATQAKTLAAEGATIFAGVKAISDQVTTLADQLITEATTMKNAAAASVVQDQQAATDVTQQIQQIQAQMQQITNQYNEIMTQLQQQLQQLQGQVTQ